jgi:phenylacetate-CoA ligase
MTGIFEIQCWLKRAYRRGPRFRKYLTGLMASGRLYGEALEYYRNDHLQRIVHHCYENIPYYTDLFNRLKLKPEDIQTRTDLEKLPFLDKHIAAQNYDKLIDVRRKNPLCHVGQTSGSTGTPGRFLRDYDVINFEHAAVWRHWMKAGDYGKKRVTIRGDIIVPAEHSEPPFWKFDPANQELLMSGYHLSFQNSGEYVHKILEFEPSILYCYPSTGYLLAKFFMQHRVSYRFDAIFTSSESLEPSVKALMERAFNTRIYDWYGQAERVAAIATCPAGRYHLQEDYSLVELLPAEDGYELTGTHLHNYVMPLLRYRTGDRVKLPPEGAHVFCPCGSAFRVADRIIGRTSGYLLTPEGYRVSIINHIPRGVDNLIETQFYQERPGEVVIRVLTNGRFTTTDRSKLIQNTLEHTSPRMKVLVEEVAEIPRGPNGKFVTIVSNLPAEEAEVGDQRRAEVTLL